MSQEFITSDAILLLLFVVVIGIVIWGQYMQERDTYKRLEKLKAKYDKLKTEHEHTDMALYWHISMLERSDSRYEELETEHQKLFDAVSQIRRAHPILVNPILSAISDAEAMRVHEELDKIREVELFNQ